MVRKIVRYPEPVLRAKCRLVTEVTSEIRTLAADMLETMRDANGVGLAAPQIAVDLQLAVIDVSHNPDCITFMKVNGEKVDMVQHMPVVLMNPQLDLGSAKEIGEEGCLSFPRLRGDIRRSSQIKVTYTNLDGQLVTVETDGLLARAFQHEIDHLNGILFIDRLNAVAKVSIKRKLARLMQEWEEDDE
ncbi:MAG: peptide deformylase [Chthoniobacter sp. 12-60-6]|nr:MAG: peptide deformylase [Chthoniobacter sp. 12-60-6]